MFASTSPTAAGYDPSGTGVKTSFVCSKSGALFAQQLLSSASSETLLLSFCSDIHPPYLNVLLPKPFVAAPIDDHHYCCCSALWDYGKAEAIRLVAGGLDDAIPIYALLVPSEHLDHDVQRLPQIQGYSWKRSNTSNTAAVIMTLKKDALRI